MKTLKTLSAVALAFLFAACSSDDSTNTSIDPVLDAKTTQLIENVSKSGAKNTELSVYASGITLGTRGCDVNGNMWLVMPEIPTSEEIEGVLQYIHDNPSAKVEWPGYTYYYVQNIGGHHHPYSYIDNNDHLHENEIDGNYQQELLSILEVHNTGGAYTHVNNFNHGECNNAATNNSALMTDGFLAARTLDENGSTDIDNYALYYWNGSYYLAFDYRRSRTDGPVAPDGVYCDWVVKIIPASGETPVDPDDPTPPVVEPLVGEVEFDIHQQEHKDWNEIKTTVHIRDTADVRIFIPVPKEYQAVSDDFDIRSDVYTYVATTTNEITEATFTIASVEYKVEVQINHTVDGIEILIDGASCADALKAARGIYNDGLTFEIHSYVYPSVTSEMIWSWLQTVECAQTSKTKWPVSGQCVTHTHGQVTSAYYPEQRKDYAKDPE